MKQIKTPYTIEQAEFVNYVRGKVEAFFADFPVPAHGYDHVARVAVRAREIAIRENARSVMLCELAGWLHDIGRVPEHFDDSTDKNHYELVYDLLRQWFKDDIKFYFLRDSEKIELLYACRYHWNDAADEYDTAWILRDADKLDGFGEIGLARTLEYHGNARKIDLDLRLHYQTLYFFRTDTARQIMKEEKLLEPIEAYYKKQLRERIVPIELD